MILKTWSWFNLFHLFLTAVLLTGCRQRTETILRGYAEEVVLALEFDILHEEHRFMFAPFDADAPTSKITSRYQVFDSPEEIIEKLRGLHQIDEAWLKYDGGQWIGTVPLAPMLVTPEEEVRWVIRPMLSSERGPNSISDSENLPDIDYLLICPWIWEEGGYTIVYADVIVLSEEGTLLIQIHASGWGRCHAPRVGRV